MDTAESTLGGHPDGTVIEIKVHPSSSRRGITGSSGGRICISVHSAPEKGKATKEALGTLSAVLGVAPSRLEVLRGQRSRNKTVLARGITPSEVRQQLKVD